MLTDFKNLSKIFSPLYIVGGCVRDWAMGNSADDMDLATPLLPEEVMRIAAENDIHAIPTGLKHGTVTIRYKGVSYEITTFRKDKNCDGRHAEVEFTDDLTADLRRRDFRMNSMAMDVHGNIIDPWGGLSDIKSGIISTNGDPEERFSEDYLRIMRLVRFQTKFLMTVREDTWNAAVKLAPNMLANVSIERVVQEIDKAFALPLSGYYIAKLDRLGLFTEIFPEYKTAKTCLHKPAHHPEGHLFNHLKLVMDKATNYKWNVLLHDVGKPAVAAPYEDYFRYAGHAHAGAKLIENIATRLKLSNELKESLETTTELHMLPWDYVDNHPNGLPMKAIKKIHIKAGPHLEALKYVCMADDGHNEFDKIKNIFDPLPVEETIQPVLMGRDLIAAGLTPGKEFSALLSKAFEIQIEEEITDKQVLLMRVLLNAGKIP